MKKVLAFIAALMLVGVACGDSGGGGVGSVDNCDDLVGEAIVMLQDVLDALSELSIEDITALGDEPPAAIEDLEQRSDELEAKAIELNCDDDELGAGVVSRADELTADGPFAELILEGIRSDPDLFGN